MECHPFVSYSEFGEQKKGVGAANALRGDGGEEIELDWRVTNKSLKNKMGTGKRKGIEFTDFTKFMNFLLFNEVQRVAENTHCLGRGGWLEIGIESMNLRSHPFQEIGTTPDFSKFQKSPEDRTHPLVGREESGKSWNRKQLTNP